MLEYCRQDEQPELRRQRCGTKRCTCMRTDPASNWRRADVSNEDDVCYLHTPSTRRAFVDTRCCGDDIHVAVCRELFEIIGMCVRAQLFAVFVRCALGTLRAGICT
jgi:hypothetical protein